ncbi:arsenate reductase/protein-tyrosine-phosphatase family protein [Mycolicibacterium confluentis]|uniref:Phosphotyrosine protein phosphatase I domain-containing protein n=1 Tax=Mycolicibacterium confluentis TaxID=28047 RepID=A0A7I7XVX4_9MYCO|nr:hypothetical protein [Mycolicibacterium confluentis]BBZ33387.1 hypothetical protein MCNF_19920 [Mycolicibacterium confluentis]
MTTKPTVLFLCTHNAGRSQMAMSFFSHLVGEQADVYSGGSEPAENVNPSAVEAMAEVGIDITGQTPKLWTHEMVHAADVVVTMGCSDTDSAPWGGGLRIGVGSRVVINESW